ncbi:MAG: hypothetical protein JWR80_4825 [Bradyrhizobium sp.]|nr:hypothetical protein [Bradyrhizobium sp.]
MSDPARYEPLRPRLAVSNDTPGPLKSGGGGGTFDPMEPRVKALEDRFAKMDSKLDAIGTDLAYIKGKLEGMPTAIAFGELKGRVDSLPTTTKAATLLGIAVAIMTIVVKWHELLAYLKA